MHRIVKFIKTENRIVISRDWGWVERVGCYCFRSIISIWEDKRKRILMVAQQRDLNTLNMVTFISNIMSLDCILFWRLPISPGEVCQCLPWPAWPCNDLCSYLTVSYLLTLFQLYWPLYKTIILCFWLCVCVCVCVCRTLCNIKVCSPPGSSVHEISQTRTLGWVIISSSGGFSRSMDQTQVSCIGKWILYHRATWEAHSLL